LGHRGPKEKIQKNKTPLKQRLDGAGWEWTTIGEEKRSKLSADCDGKEKTEVPHAE